MQTKFVTVLKLINEEKVLVFFNLPPNVEMKNVETVYFISQI